MEAGAFVFLTGPGDRASPATSATCLKSNPNAPDALSVAGAVTSSPLWREFSKAALVVRTAPENLVAVAGYFQPADHARLRELLDSIRNDLPRVRYINYDQAQADCLRLASALRERFGPAARDEFHYVAIPRGGHIVLGMLSYALDLPAARLAPPESPGVPLVVVDDCALSGARFKGVLPGFVSETVVFAPLYSPPELRRAIVEKESRVIACLSAADLRDEAPDRQGEGYADWLAFQRRKRGESGYWYGQYGPFGFAWNEPDAGFWNPVTKRREKAWNLLPPELCLKNRIGADPDAARIQVNEDGPGPIVPAASVLFADFGDSILIGDARSGGAHALAGVGADMWRALATTGGGESALATLRSAYDVDDATLRRDFDAFAGALFDKGLLERRRAGGA
jgi:hypothetical protein